MTLLKQFFSMLKPHLHWVILGGSLFFLVATLRLHWQEVVEIRVSQTGWGYLSVALLATFLAHVWSGWVWSWILRSLHQPALGIWGVLTYLKTNIAKYLPGNVWHLYGRVVASKAEGFSVGAATVSVVLEALLMAAAALSLALISYEVAHVGFNILLLAGVLVGIHPRVLNPMIRFAAKIKRQGQGGLVRLDRYPILPLLGELGFLALRGLGFLAIVMALMGTQSFPVLPVLSAFSIAWMLGLLVPGAPGGVGVFEVTFIALIDSVLPAGILLAVVTFYRFISTSAEAIGAGLAYGYEHFSDRDLNPTNKP